MSDEFNNIGLRVNYMEESFVKCYCISVDVNPEYVEDVWYSTGRDGSGDFVTFTFFSEGLSVEEIVIYIDEYISDYSITPLKRNYQLNLYTSGSAEDVTLEHCIYRQGVKYEL